MSVGSADRHDRDDLKPRPFDCREDIVDATHSQVHVQRSGLRRLHP